METNALPQSPLELLNLATGYQRSKTLFFLIESALPTHLSSRQLSASEIADILGMHIRATEAFLRSCVVLNLIEAGDGKYSNSALAETFLVREKATYIGDEFARYDQTSYAAWNDLDQRLREWQPGMSDESVPVVSTERLAGIRSRHNFSLLVGEALAGAYDFSRHKVILDLGGGTGATSISICRQYPEIRSIVFDFPFVTEVAQEYIQAQNLCSRIGVSTGNFKIDALPSGFDLALLANLVSVASEESNRALFKRIYERLPHGGAIIISGYILNDQWIGPDIPTLFCLQDIIRRAPDVEREESTYTKWLTDAGFQSIERRVYYEPTSMLIGRKELP